MTRNRRKDEILVVSERCARSGDGDQSRAGFAEFVHLRLQLHHVRQRQLSKQRQVIQIQSFIKVGCKKTTKEMRKSPNLFARVAVESAATAEHLFGRAFD